MSSLQLSGLGKFSPEWGGFPSWTGIAKQVMAPKMAKEARKERLQISTIAAAERVQAQQLQQESMRFKAISDLQVGVNSKLQQLEGEAQVAAQVVLKIRELAQSPVLEGDQSLRDLALVLADLEKAVITIQVGTVVDPASPDTAVLAEGYANAQAGFVAMQAVTSRAQGTLKALELRVKDLNDEQIRLRMADEARLIQDAAARREQVQLEEQQRADQQQRAVEAARLRRRDVMARVMQLDIELGREKRRLSSLRVELAQAKFQASERFAR